MTRRLSQWVGIRAAVTLLALLVTASALAVVTVTPAEMAEKNKWLQENLLSTSAVPPFSFVYDGTNSADLLHSWARSDARHKIDARRTEHIITWTDSANQLVVKCVAVDYRDFPMVEWTVYLTNAGSGPTPILQNIQGLNVSLSRRNGPEFILHGNQGDYDSPSGYAPYQLTLAPSTVKTFSPPSYSGKPCDGPNAWPYYNLQMPGGGIILAIGWPGQWASSFTRDADNDLQIQAGQQLTHLTLNPGEVIRTPLIAMMFWQGNDVVRSQNIWRHWYLAHEIPRINGQPPTTIVDGTGDSTNDVNRYLQRGIKPDILWRDADTEPYVWYPCTNGPYTGSISWLNTGTWEVDTNSYPNGFKGVTTAIHALGMKFLLWFEPERVGDPKSWLATQHPEWLLPRTQNTVGEILNEGNPVAFNWLTNHIEGLILSNGIDWYREDMNGDGPLTAWQNNDATNRQGITENFYVQGHLAYWDALLAMNPGLRIDSCASGGRRNDLESMRRAVPLWRSDFPGGAKVEILGNGNQCLTYGLSSWLPFQGSASGGFWDSYSTRSSYLPSFSFGLSPSREQATAIAECRRIAPIMLNGDYYPLTPYSLSDNTWLAWQFDRPGHGDGLVQAFRRVSGDASVQAFRLSGLDPRAHYKITNFDLAGTVEFSGEELMDKGLTVEIKDKPGAAVILYQRLKRF